MQVKFFFFFFSAMYDNKTVEIGFLNMAKKTNQLSLYEALHFFYKFDNNT